jgi:hypothetical protein
LPLPGLELRPSARRYTGSRVTIFVIKLKHSRTSTYDLQHYDPINLTPITFTLRIFLLQLETRTPNSPVATALSGFDGVPEILDFHEEYVFVYIIFLNVLPARIVTLNDPRQNINIFIFNYLNVYTALFNVPRFIL